MTCGQRPLGPSTETIMEWLVEQLAESLGVQPSEIAVSEPFESYGLSSSEAVLLSGDLEEWLGCRLPPTLLWEYSTIESLARHLAGEVAESKETMQTWARPAADAVAIIGIGCRFPGADGPDAFWQLMMDGVDAIGEVPADRWDSQTYYDTDVASPGKMNTRWGGFVDGIDQFDADFFGISPREATRMDPQQRLLLEITWEALEDAGQPPGQLSGSLTGVFVGISSSDYARFQFFDTALIDAYAATGNAHSIAANRISYLLDLQGPSLAIDTACSSSLVAVHEACQSLHNGECSLALAGGVNLILTPELTVNFSKAGVMSPDGRCKTFDALANGYVRGEGGAMVVLKPLSKALEDGDRLYAVIRSSAVNHDGRSNGLMAPNPLSQQTVLREAYRRAGISPGEVQYVECHGTGTLLGDPIEANALGAVLDEGRDPENRCFIGSVKTNIGHLEAAAGVAGLVKVALALKHHVIPPSLHFHEPNPHIPFDDLPLQVVTSSRPWPNDPGPALAGVSSFGFGGTNSHAVLSDAPPQDMGSQLQDQSGRQAHILPISARGAEALHALARSYHHFLSKEAVAKSTSLHDIAYTASVRRPHYKNRLAITGRTQQELVNKLESFLGDQEQASPGDGRNLHGAKPKAAFVFSGQGSQWVGMGQELMEREPLFRQEVERCERAFEPYVEWSLRKVLEGQGTQGRLDQIDVVQPVLFAVQIGLANLWRSWSVHPDAVVGHSMGEVAAAHVAGALTLEDAARVICSRSRLMKQQSGHGAMLLAALSLPEALELLGDRQDLISVAANNGPKATILSGDPESLQEVAKQLAQDGLFHRFVNVDVAAHSPQMDPLLAELDRELQRLQPCPAQVPYYSTVTGECHQEHLLGAGYWVRNLRQPVRFAEAVQRMLDDGTHTFLEISPHPILISAVKQGLGHRDLLGVTLASARRNESALEVMLSSLGILYERGYNLDWSKLYPSGGVVSPLPSYPWQKRRYWLEEAAAYQDSSPIAERHEGDDAPSPDEVEDWFHELRWLRQERSAAVPVLPQSEPGTWLIFCDSLGIGETLAMRLCAESEECILVTAAEQYAQTNERQFQIRLQNPTDLSRLLDTAFTTDQATCRGLIYLWALDIPPAPELTFGDLEGAQARGCITLTLLIQELEKTGWREAPKLWLVTSGAVQVLERSEVLSPAQAPIWGFGRALAQELPALWGGLTDLEPGERTATAAEFLYQQIRHPDGEDQSAMRQGERYVARLDRGLTPAARTASLHFKRDASYLITGGLGDLGLKLARWMVKEGASRLILLGRTGLPDRLEWSKITEDGRAARRIAAIRALEAMGASVHVVAADVADEAQLAEFLDIYHRAAWPSIRGVFHLAGVVEPVLIHQMAPEDLAEVMRPKVEGGWLLHHLFENEPLDYFVLFSSAASVLSSPFLSGYAAANAFLDSLAHYRRAAGLPATSINWGFWSSVGMAARFENETGRDLTPRGMYAFSPEQGMIALKQILRQNPVQVAVMSVDWTIWCRDHLGAGPAAALSLLTEGDAALVGDRGGTAPIARSRETLGQLGQEPLKQRLIALTPEERQSVLEIRLRRLVAKVLYLDEDSISASGNLMDLGLDSLMAMELIRGAERELQLRLYPREIFERPSISDLAAYLSAELAGDQGRELAIDELHSAPPVPAREALVKLAAPIAQSDLPVATTTNPSMVFLLSAPRSGSTLLRVMLAGHPRLFCPPELHLLPFGTMDQRQDQLRQTYLDEGLQRAFMELMGLGADDSKALIEDLIARHAHVQDVYAHLQALAGDRLLVDKSPSYAADKKVLQRAELLFDRPKFIHLVRHPYAVIESAVRIRLDRLLAVQDVDPYAFAEELWSTMVANTCELFALIPPERTLLVHFEDLVREPEAAARRLCEFLEIDYEETLLTPYRGKRMTDGIYSASVSTGDPNFLKHNHIEKSLGEAWKNIQLPRRLSFSTGNLARDLRYELPREIQGHHPLNHEAFVPATKIPLSESPKPDRVASTLVLMQPNGNKRPLFFVHPASGMVFPYYDLARALGQERPFYALQDPCLEGQCEPYSTLEEYATNYTDAVRSVQPEGPYFLGGWSFGGTLAVEMARQLHDLGQEVGLLLAIDSESPLGNRTLNWKQRSSYLLQRTLGLLKLLPYVIQEFFNAVYLLAATTIRNEQRRGSRMSTIDVIRYAWFDGLRRSLERQAGIAQVASRDQRLLQLRFPTRSVRHALSTLRHHFALIRFCHLEPYEGKLTLLRASGKVPRRHFTDATLGWGDIILRGVDVHVVPGNHMALFHDPYLTAVAQAIQGCVDRAEVEIDKNDQTD